MLPKLKKYNKKLTHSYSFGIYSTLGMLESKEGKVIEILVHSSGMEIEDVQKILDIADKAQIPHSIENRIIEKIAYKANTYVVGVFEKYEEELSNEKSHIVLVNPRNSGNIGTILRTMLGFEYEDLCIIRPAVDVFEPKVISSTVGAFFKSRIQYFDSYEEYVEKFESHKQYLFTLSKSKNIKDVTFDKLHSLVLGNENNGLDDELLQYGESVYIPHAKDLESLNLSIAAGVAMYEVSKDKFK